MRLAIMAAAFIAGAAPCSALAAACDKAGIVKFEHDLAAVQSVADGMKFYAPGGAVLYDAVAPGVVHGAPAIEENFKKQFVGTSSAEVRIKELDAGCDGNIGYAFSVQRALIKKTDGATMDLTFRQTDVLRRGADGRWLIVHQHISYPVDMATGKAVLTPVP